MVKQIEELQAENKDGINYSFIQNNLFLSFKCIIQMFIMNQYKLVSVNRNNFWDNFPVFQKSSFKVTYNFKKVKWKFKEKV